MAFDLLTVFFILLLAFMIFTLLGYKIEGMENQSTSSSDSPPPTPPVTMQGTNGEFIALTTNADGSKTLMMTYSDGTTYTYTSASPSSSTYQGPNGTTATITTGNNGGKSIVITDNQGNTIAIIKTKDGDVYSGSNYDNYNHYDGANYPVIYYGPDGGTARVVKTGDNDTIVITSKNGTTEIYYIDSGSSITGTKNVYYGPNGSSATIFKGSDGKMAVKIQRADGTTTIYTSDNKYSYNTSVDSTINQYSSDTNNVGSDYNSAYSSTSYNYSSTLPQGIPKSQIPDGQEDLYILKSEVVPPVCPKCPEPILKCPDSNDTTKCPPCPPCARCPEPNFSCRKVANYNAFNPDTMPIPVLNSFSSFGM